VRLEDVAGNLKGSRLAAAVWRPLRSKLCCSFSSPDRRRRVFAVVESVVITFNLCDGRTRARAFHLGALDVNSLCVCRLAADDHQAAEHESSLKRLPAEGAASAGGGRRSIGCTQASRNQTRLVIALGQAEGWGLLPRRRSNLDGGRALIRVGPSQASQRER
jgi:hypothetical protein